MNTNFFHSELQYRSCSFSFLGLEFIRYNTQHSYHIVLDALMKNRAHCPPLRLEAEGLIL